ncbi:MAG: PQQ-binding-like beta-propeller repeat protein [Dehalococcoidia bacterium]|nr:PQQ-binding-like beta-propeller repeat protein [Dehalococcoidia bacterium]
MSTPTSKGIWATPILDGDTLYIGTMDGEVHAITLPGGEPAWDEPFTAATGAVPELGLLEDEGLLWVPTIGKTVYLVDPATGSEAGESLQSENWVWTTPVVRDGIAYYGDFAGFVHAVDITTGEERWEQQVGDKVKAGPALIDDTLIVADRSSTITFLDVETGEIRNAVNRDDAGTFRANLVARDGVAYALGTSGTLFRADPETLRVVPLEITGAPD